MYMCSGWCIKCVGNLIARIPESILYSIHGNVSISYEYIALILQYVDLCIHWESSAVYRIKSFLAHICQISEIKRILSVLVCSDRTKSYSSNCVININHTQHIRMLPAFTG